jgi:hypothetical protein
MVSVRIHETLERLQVLEYGSREQLGQVISGNELDSEELC